MVPEINIWAVIVATLASMVVGSIWYSNIAFGKYWQQAARVSMEDRNPIIPIVTTLIVSFITALVLAGSTAIAQHFYEGNFLVNAVLTSLILWAGFTAARVITHDSFEGRPRMLTLLTITHELVTIVIMGFIIGLFGFPG